MSRKLNIKEVIINGEKFKVTRLTDKDFRLPKYAVIISDICVETKFAGHLFGYVVASLLFMAENFEGPIPGFQERILAKDLYRELELLANEGNGVVAEYKWFSIVSTVRGANSLTTKSRFPELHKEIQGATFINARLEQTNTSDVMKAYAENWVAKNSLYIWGVRVLLYMFLEDFFAENSITEWRKIMKDKVGVTIKQKSFYNKNYSALEFYTTLQDDIIKSFKPSDQDRVREVIDTYPTIRDLLGVTPYYKSLWDTNFYKVDLDHLIDIDNPRDFTKQQELRTLLSKQKGIVIEDTNLGLTINIPEDKLQEVSYSKNSDVAYLKFVAPRTLVLNSVYNEGEVVSGFAIDKYSLLNTEG